jgi:hypothetical protein
MANKKAGWSDSMRALHDARHQEAATEEGGERGQRTVCFDALGGDVDQEVIDKSRRLGGEFDVNLHEKSRAYEQKQIDLRSGRYMAPAL